MMVIGSGDDNGRLKEECRKGLSKNAKTRAATKTDSATVQIGRGANEVSE